ncbi:MAG: hypothetical protein K5978_04785 [Campylobacter sp.]|nr:hypothetical protein [Campylobacter sp.]
MKKIFVTSLATLAILSTSVLAREYKCTDRDVIIAGLKKNPSSLTTLEQDLEAFRNYRPWKIDNVKERGFTEKTMIGCTADTKLGATIYYVIHIDKETGKAYVNSSPTSSYKKFKKIISKKGHGAYLPLN